MKQRIIRDLITEESGRESAAMNEVRRPACRVRTKCSQMRKVLYLSGTREVICGPQITVQDAAGSFWKTKEAACRIFCDGCNVQLFFIFIGRMT